MSVFYTIKIYNSTTNDLTMYVETDHPSRIMIDNKFYPFTFNNERGFHYDRFELYGITYDITYIISGFNNRIVANRDTKIITGNKLINLS